MYSNHDAMFCHVDCLVIATGFAGNFHVNTKINIHKQEEITIATCRYLPGLALSEDNFECNFKNNHRILTYFSVAYNLS